MRILHTSDWHLGKWLGSFSRIEEQRIVLEEICDICETQNIDAVAISGDLYDNFNPPIEAQELLYKTLKRLANNGKRPVIAIAGNHDSPERIESPDPLARECGIIFSGHPNSIASVFELDGGFKILKTDEGFIEIKLFNNDIPLRILTVPYANEYRMKTFLGCEDKETAMREVLQQKWKSIAEKYIDNNGVNIMIAHLFVGKEGEPLPIEDLDEMKPINSGVGGAQIVYSSNIPSGLNYVALGHLHRKQNIDKKPCSVVYCGSPLAYSFSEANQSKYVLLVDIGPNKETKITPIELLTPKKLVRKSFNNTTEAIEWLESNQDVLIELTIVTDFHLNAEDQKKLYSANKNIVELHLRTNIEGENTLNNTNIDIEMNISNMFVEYFKSQNSGIAPDETIMNLFKEVIAEEEVI